MDELALLEVGGAGNNLEGEGIAVEETLRELVGCGKGGVVSQGDVRIFETKRSKR